MAKIKHRPHYDALLITVVICGDNFEAVGEAYAPVVRSEVQFLVLNSCIAKAAALFLAGHQQGRLCDYAWTVEVCGIKLVGRYQRNKMDELYNGSHPRHDWFRWEYTVNVGGDYLGEARAEAVSPGQDRSAGNGAGTPAGQGDGPSQGQVSYGVGLDVPNLHRNGQAPGASDDHYPAGSGGGDSDPGGQGSGNGS